MPVLEACPLQLLAETLDIAELNSRTIRLSAASVLQINVLDIISYNYINYLEKRNGFSILRSGGTSYA
jgi:hypothetical protein